MDIKTKLSEEFKLLPKYASNIVDLIEEGNTIPFIARYRKEMHGGCNDELLRDFADRLTYLKNLETRKEEVRSSIEGQGKWTDELAAALEKVTTRILEGEIPPSFIIYAVRSTITEVFPDPGPARTIIGPDRWAIALN